MKLKLTNPFAKPQHVKDMEETLAVLSKQIKQAKLNEVAFKNVMPSERDQMEKDIAAYREITEILEIQRKQRLSKEKKAEIIAYIVGILLILNYEQTRALTSKATSQLPHILR